MRAVREDSPASKTKVFLLEIAHAPLQIVTIGGLREIRVAPRAFDAFQPKQYSVQHTVHSPSVYRRGFLHFCLTKV